MPLLERSFRCRSIFRAAILGLALVWLSYVYWAGPIYEGKRLRFWVQSAIEKYQNHVEDLRDEVAAIEYLDPGFGEALLATIPTLSDRDSLSPLARLALSLPESLRREGDFPTPAQRKAAVIGLASRLRLPRERAFQVFWSSGQSSAEEVRYAASQALARLEPLRQAELIQLLNSKQWELRQVGFWSCMEPHSAPFALPYIERSMQAGEHDRFVALRAAARLGEPGWPILERALASTNTAMAQPALMAMASSPRNATFPVSLGALILKHARKSGNRPGSTHRYATEALGCLADLPPEAAALLAEALATDPGAWGYDAVAALSRSPAHPAKKAAVLVQSLQQTTEKKIPALVERIAALTRRGVIGPGEGDKLGESLVHAYEKTNIRAMPMALPLLGTLAPRNERVQRYLAAMTRARDPAIVTRALWGLARTDLPPEKKIEIARSLLAEENPPPALFYLLASTEGAAKVLIPDLEARANAPHSGAFAAAARKFLDEVRAGAVWDGKIPVGENSQERQYPEFAGMLQAH